MASISFYTQNNSKVKPGIKPLLKTCINKLVKAEGYRLAELSVIMVSDEQLMEMNKQFLDHHYYTDIITFDQSEEEGIVEGELYISTDRIKDNAISFGEDESKEFCRVVIHGTLHLVGYGDKTKKQQAEMREKENHYLTLCGY
jgi:rRNA maturation RNase YbeY